MDMRRTNGNSCIELRVLVVDENPCHAEATESTLAKLNFQAKVYTSPIKALDFLKDHEADVDFVLVAVHMREMHGFQFLDISREMHRNLQVIMMSAETTWPIMQRCVELGARFLVKQPVDTTTMCNIWQYLDHKLLRMEKIKQLFKGIQGKTHGVNYSSKDELEKSVNKCGEGTRKKTAHLMWTPFLQKKFLHAHDLLGDAATPKKIEMIMNVNSIDRKQISAHLQKHRKRMEKKRRVLKKSSKSASRSEPLKTCETLSNMFIVLMQEEEVPSDQTKIITKETHGNTVYEAMRKALQLGTVFDEQLLNDPCTEEAHNVEADMMGDGIVEDNNKTAAGQEKVVPETHNAKNVSNKADFDQAGLCKLVTYSDSEDDEVAVNV
ncbi:hypothetical protein EJB05_37205, partial [Eragrostis curvula]